MQRLSPGSRLTPQPGCCCIACTRWRTAPRTPLGRRESARSRSAQSPGVPPRSTAASLRFFGVKSMMRTCTPISRAHRRRSFRRRASTPAAAGAPREPAARRWVACWKLRDIFSDDWRWFAYRGDSQPVRLGTVHVRGSQRTQVDDARPPRRCGCESGDIFELLPHAPRWNASRRWSHGSSEME